MVVDARNPKRPRKIAEIDLGRFFDGGEANGVESDAQYVHVADNGDGIEVLDAGVPGTLREVAQYRRASAHGGIVYDGSYLYVADARRGLLILKFQ